MKDIPIWARWNGQEVLSITRGERGWHTYYLRRGAHGAPLPRAAEWLAHALARLATLCGKPLRRLVAARALRREAALKGR